jgi:hypothetical protein
MFSFSKKPLPILKQEDIDELRELERKAYLEEARKLVKERGILKAKAELGVKEVKKDQWQIV